MVLRRGQQPKPINIPQRGKNGQVDSHRGGGVPNVPLQRHPAGRRYSDPRQLRQLKVRLDFEADTNPLAKEENFDVMSPDDEYIRIDSADEIIQPYTLPSSTGTWGCQLLRPFVDPIHNILVTYHFDHMDLRWVRMTTRLSPDLRIPRPPANQHTNSPQYYFGSRGSRYVRHKRKVTEMGRRKKSHSNRLYRGRAGTSGARGTTGEFRGGLR